MTGALCVALPMADPCQTLTLHSVPDNSCVYVPCCVSRCRVVYDRGFVRGLATMGTPVRPGVSRVFFAFVTPPGELLTVL
jgi:hypothetical protein